VDHVIWGKLWVMSRAIYMSLNAFEVCKGLNNPQSVLDEEDPGEKEGDACNK